ncbi:MAG: xanthine dehydrogenase family protein molybdopterin-binding subunit, partial [Gammaproteobacteria bacterium]
MATVTVTERKRWVGANVKRKEDPRFLTGTGRFVDDIRLPDMLHAALVRSPYAHARIRSINATKAVQHVGVHAVVTGKDIAEASNSLHSVSPMAAHYYCMAVDKARHVGEPVAAVIATDRYTAEDAAQMVEVEYEALPAVIDPEAAASPSSPVLHEEAGTNVNWRGTLLYGEVDQGFQRASHVIREKFRVHRFCSTPIETYGCIAAYDRVTGNMTVWASCQIGAVLIPPLAHALKIPVGKLRIICPDIGGGFGNKIGLTYMILTAILAGRVGRPVKLIEDRRESIQGLQHGSESRYDVEAAVDKDGRILALRINLLEDVGAYAAFPEPEGVVEQVFTGAYRIPAYSLNATIVLTNKCITGPNRGYGRYNVHFMLERLVDRIAKKLGLSPVEMRLRNYVRKEDFPYTTPSGNIYDGGDYAGTLRRALEVLDYDYWKSEQARLRPEGRYIGVGLASMVEVGTPDLSHFHLISKEPPGGFYSSNSEAATVRIDPVGRVTVATGTAPQGQGQETAVAQIVADELGLDVHDVEVLPGFDSATHPYTGASGTYGSRFGGVVVGAVVQAARAVRAKLLRAAGGLLGELPERLD